MGSELKSVGDLAASGIISLSTGPFGSALHKHDYRESGRPVVPAEAISDGDLDLSKLNYIDEGKAEELTRYFLEPGDLVFARRGAQACGHSAYVTREHNGAVAGTGLLYVRVLRKDVLDPFYFFLVMSSAESVRWLKTHAIGATMPNLNTGIISSTPFCLIPLDQQHEIVSQYLPIRNKLSLLSRMNATLEGMAQALFKSWFVDFDPVIDNALAAGNPIPDELADRAEVRRKILGERSSSYVTSSKDGAGASPGSDIAPAMSSGKMDGAGAPSLPEFPAAFQQTESMGWIPEGWEVGSFLDEAKLLSGGTPKTSEPEYWNGGVKWASAKDVSQCGKTFLIDTEKTISVVGLNKSATKIIPKFSTVVVARGATTGRMTMFGEDIAMNQTCYGMRMKSGNHFYGYCHSKNLITNLVGAAHGSVFDTITTTTFESSKVLQVPQNLTDQFEEQVAPDFQKILSNQEQTNTLTKLRDTLLPKLISGELRIPAAEQLTEGALV